MNGQWHGIAPIMTVEPTAQFILIAVKALLRNDVPAKAILAAIADLEQIGEQEREQAERRRAETEQVMRDVFTKANL